MYYFSLVAHKKVKEKVKIPIILSLKGLFSQIPLFK